MRPRSAPSRRARAAAAAAPHTYHTHDTPRPRARETAQTMHSVAKVAILTAGGLAPCLSSAVGFLIEKYTARNPSIEIICYISGYKGLLSGEHVKVTGRPRKRFVLQLHGGSPIGNSESSSRTSKTAKRRSGSRGENPT